MADQLSVSGVTERLLDSDARLRLSRNRQGGPHHRGSVFDRSIRYRAGTGCRLRPRRRSQISETLRTYRLASSVRVDERYDVGQNRRDRILRRRERLDDRIVT
nr:hypothetical protein [Paraburkholderia sp. BL6665CI2N2]